MEKSKTKRILRMGVMLYIVILILVMVTTLAWFIFDENANIVAESGVKIKAGTNLEIARWTGSGWTDYGSEIEIKKEDLDFACPDITGGIVNGQLKFYYPKVLDDNDNVMADHNLLEELDGSEGYYMELRIKFRTSVDMGIYLTRDSFVKPIDTTKKDSTYGSATSTDYIAGASRISFSEVTSVDENGNITGETLKNIWVPNDHYELYYQDEKVQVDEALVDITKAYVNEAGERELYYRDKNDPNYGSKLPYGYLGKVDNTVVSYAWSEADYYNKLITVGNTPLVQPISSGIPTLNDACELVTFENLDGKLTEKEVVIRIWFEGTDREADEALNGGDVTYQLSFIGTNKSAAPAENTQKLNSLVYNKAAGTLLVGETAATEADNILYSFNGIDWELYNNTGNNSSPLSANTNDYVYVKIRETATAKETAVRVLTVANAQ